MDTFSGIVPSFYPTIVVLAETHMHGSVRSQSSPPGEVHDLRLRVAELERRVAAGQAAEASLRQSEELNRRILEAIPGGIVTVNLDGSMVQANREALRILGLSWEELSRRYVRDFDLETIWEDGSPCPASDYPVSRCLRSGLSQPAATIGMRRPNGTLSWALITAVPLHDPATGRQSGAVVTMLDITERKRSEEALRESETRFRQLAENIREVFFIVSGDGRQCIYVSPAYESVWGNTRQSLYDRPQSYMDSVLAEDLPGLTAVFDMCVREGSGSAEFRITRPDGSIRWIWDRAFPIRDERGAICRIVGLAEDITERKRLELEHDRLLAAEQAARIEAERSRAHLLDTLESITDGFFTLDRDWRITYLNPQAERMMQQPRGELLGRTLWDRFPAAVGSRFQREYERALAEHVTVEFEEYYPPFERWFEVHAYPTAEGLAVHFRDVTLREESRLRMQESADRLRTLSRRLLEVQEQERRHLARELHDEIGQQLTGLKLALEANALGPDRLPRASLDPARELVKDLTARVRDLSLRLRPAMLDDLGLLPALVWHFERFTALTRVHVHFECGPLNGRFPPEVETAVFRVAQEALTNVARHAGVHEAIVRLWRDDARLFLQVEDKGVGFDASEPLAQGASTGLPGMRERAVLLGGQWSLESVVGRGTSLLAEFPVPAEAEDGRHAFEAVVGG